eukprot:TRINITY_DN11316_c0_g1_i1.p1 TRINITY_DN11316_c0_g1~~TRINITY_DN11316_c0_g1_i1.p1  ORF type:complete len:280 (+),score=10.04 TRINITY_DN11316_c0_g1_i1:94-840(+)
MALLMLSPIIYLASEPFRWAVGRAIRLPLSLVQFRQQLNGAGVRVETPSMERMLWPMICSLPVHCIQTAEGFMPHYAMGTAIAALSFIVVSPLDTAVTLMSAYPEQYPNFSEVVNTNDWGLYNGFLAYVISALVYKAVRGALYPLERESREDSFFSDSLLATTFCLLLVYPLNTILRVQQLTGESLQTATWNIFSTRGVAGFFGGAEWVVLLQILGQFGTRVVEKKLVGFARNFPNWFNSVMKTLLGK